MKTFQMPHFTFRAPLNHTPCQRNNLFFIQTPLRSKVKVCPNVKIKNKKPKKNKNKIKTARKKNFSVIKNKRVNAKKQTKLLLKLRSMFLYSICCAQLI